MLNSLNILPDKNLLVGIDSVDDAAIYKLNDNTAVVYTLDFFTPIADDPYTFGSIAAANSMSDCYAMGAEPKLCLNIVGWPNCLEVSWLKEMLRGGADKIAEAGAVLAGGHTVQDDEPKFGLSVVGFVEPDKYWKNNSLEEGDVLFLTKPIGVGIINTAQKGGIAKSEDVKEAIHSMNMLNKIGYELAKDLEVSACTDITGFGLAGHLFEMANNSGHTIIVEMENVPFIKGALNYLTFGMVPEGTYDNYNYVDDNIVFSDDITTAQKDLLFDPQTSGGLLFSLKEEQAEILEERFKNVNIATGRIGRVVKQLDKAIIVE